MKRATMTFGLLSLTLATTLWGCSGSSGSGAVEPATKNPGDFQVQTTYDQDLVAFRFMWKSHAKTSPATFPNTGQVYPGQYHDMLVHNGTSFDRLTDGQRMDEDRVSFMLEDPARPVTGFRAAGCFISCHNDMLPSPVKDHYLSSAGFLDHWHWRGGRSGPMGYAEDAHVDEVTRQRDSAGTPPSRWLRSGGDRLREDQPAFGAGLTGHAVLTDRLPRFVFNKGKNMPGGFQIPSHFLATDNGTVVTDPYSQLSQIKEVGKNGSLLVVYQDRTFDQVEKVNSLDLGYLVYVATGQVNHLPAHLQDTAGAAFAAWTTFWAAEIGIAANPGNTAVALAAKNRLDDVHAEWVSSGKRAMVTRSVAFIYPSDQHDITSTRAFDAARGVWTVTLFRKLDTGTASKDTNLALLRTGQTYNLAFAIHDVGAGSESHHVTFPYQLGNATTLADIKAQQVADVTTVDWNNVPALLTRVFQPGTKTGTVLKDSARHPGAGAVGVTSCQSCHSPDTMPPLFSR
ncbi:MAG: hypothetical protein A2X80_09880 [Geobacteraceae bacterium GWB2_52_12]|nr:MAG: hypothetical protein A2X80_09880 [Geobacteraceae bacterium GWB2_52_12]